MEERRELTSAELFVLREVQAHWGDQNTTDEVFFTDGGKAAGSAPVEPSEMGAEHCPECDGLDISRMVRGRRVAFLSWLVIGFPLWRPRSTWRYSQCGRMQQ